LAIGEPSGPAGGVPGAAGGAAPCPLAPGKVEAVWLIAGAAEVQPWGTDNTPSEAARPALAVTAASPIPDELKAPVPEPTPLLSVDPNAPNPLPKTLVEFISEPAEPSVARPDVNIDADEPAPDTRLVPAVTAVDDEVRVVKDDSGDVEDDEDVAADASPCIALGIAALDSGADNIELSGETVCTPVPAEVPAACVTAADIPANPPGLVVSSGRLNAVNVDAAEAAPA
jgi:hypothetical protein